MTVMLFPPGMNQSPVIGRHDIRLMKSTNKSPVVVIFDHGNIGDITFNPPTEGSMRKHLMKMLK